jgi:hypothetical protein
MANYHLHHIIPKHMGGSDDPSNLIKLTIEEHALAHKDLYDQHGKIEDLIAYRMLSGQISAADAIRIIQQKPKSQEHKDKIRASNIATKNQPHIKETASKRTTEAWANGFKGFTGHTHSDEVRKKVGDAHRGKLVSEETKSKLRQNCKRVGQLNGMYGVTRPRVTCPHCGKDVDPANASRWHFDRCRDQL